MADTWILVASVALVAVGIAGLIASRKPKSEPPKPEKAPPKPAQPTIAQEPAETSKLVPLHVYYGSQTGTAEGFSKQIFNDAKRHGFKATVVDLENFDVDTFVGTAKIDAASGHPHVAVFVMATYGEGDPTDNAVTFTKWLKVRGFRLKTGRGIRPGWNVHVSGRLALLQNTSHPADLLTGLRFVVFGLGNRQYEHYNAMGRLVNQRLGELGASPVYRYGEGDDDGTLEEDFDGWKADMWNGIKADLGLMGTSNLVPFGVLLRCSGRV
jgi:NADPH-ferrihemoprotein reductase